MNPSLYEITILGSKKKGIYKDGGYFAFSNLPDGNYPFEIAGSNLNSHRFDLQIPREKLLIESHGDNELIVSVESIKNENEIWFEPQTLSKDIPKGASVFSDKFSTHTMNTISVGLRRQVKLEKTGTLSKGDIIRIIRDNSIRMKFHPYYLFPYSVTQVTGRIDDGLDSQYPEASLPPMNKVKVTITHINDSAIERVDVGGVIVGKVRISGKVVIIGSKKDFITHTNKRGHFHFYFPRSHFIYEDYDDDTQIVKKKDILKSITLTAYHKGYQKGHKKVTIHSEQRKNINFKLKKIN